MVEMVVLSGKGGTGKTTVTAAFAHLAENHIICDLDVDAPDLHILLSPKKRFEKPFESGNEAVINGEKCSECGQCITLCRYDAIDADASPPVVNPLKCEGCKLCVHFCPEEAIDFPLKHCGNWYTSDTRFGPMVHAQLFPGEENSGLLVASLRREAKELAEKENRSLILSDGPPGIGCPVISSLSGAGVAVIVTEPTPSGLHDLQRVSELCRHFGVTAGVIINKFDLNESLSSRIEEQCREDGIRFIARLPHDPEVVKALVNRQAVTEVPGISLGDSIRTAWEKSLAMAKEKETAN